MCILSKLLDAQIWQELDGAARMMNAGKLGRRAFLSLCLLPSFAFIYLCFYLPVWVLVAGACGISHCGTRAPGHTGSVPVACGVLVPQPGIEPSSPALQGGLFTLWTTREVPSFSYSLGENSAPLSTHDILPSYLILKRQKREEWFSHF